VVSTRLRRLTALLVLALALAGCGESTGGTEPEATGSRTEATTTLFLAGDGQMWVVDVDDQRAEHLRMPNQLSAGDPPHKIAAIGERLALWSYDVTSVPMDDPSAPPETLAKDGWIFIPAANRDRIWVGYLNPDHAARERPLGELREIDAHGAVITRGVEPPGGAWPYAELADGLLFQGPGVIRLWDPDRGETVRTYRYEEIGDMGPVTGNLLASCVQSCEELILTDFGTDEQVRITAPDGLAFVAYEGSFSPDGSTLAVPVKQAGGGWQSFSEYGRELAMVSLATRETQIVPGSAVTPGYVFTAWSSDGDEVFMTGGVTKRELIAYTVGHRRARTLEVRVGHFYDIATD